MQELREKLDSVQKALTNVKHRLQAFDQEEQLPPLSAFAPALLLRAENLTNTLLRETVEAITVEPDGR